MAIAIQAILAAVGSMLSTAGILACMATAILARIRAVGSMLPTAAILATMAAAIVACLRIYSPNIFPIIFRDMAILLLSPRRELHDPIFRNIIWKYILERYSRFGISFRNIFSGNIFRDGMLKLEIYFGFVASLLQSLLHLAWPLPAHPQREWVRPGWACGCTYTGHSRCGRNGRSGHSQNSHSYRRQECKYTCSRSSISRKYLKYDKLAKSSGMSLSLRQERHGRQI